MPLDQTNWKPETETKPDLSKPSLEGLSWLLRHQLPQNYTWNFSFSYKRTECGTAGCALGVARCVWRDFPSAYGAREIADFFGMPLENYERIFFAGMSSHYPVPDYLVTPQMVADRIDAYLAETRK